MVNPVWVSHSRGLTPTANKVNFPIPGGTVDGDLMVILVGDNDLDQTITSYAGFTEVVNIEASDNNGPHFHIMWRERVAGDPASSYVITFASSSVEEGVIGRVTGFRKVAGSAVDKSVSNASLSGNEIVLAGVTPAETDTLLIGGVYIGNNTSAFNASGSTIQYSDTTDPSFYVWTKNLSGAATQDIIPSWTGTQRIGAGFATIFPVETVATNINTFINIGDSFKNVSADFINVGDAWKNVSKKFINIGDAWKNI